MRLWVRSRVQNSVIRLFTLNRIGHLEWQGALPTDTLSRYEAKPACAEHLCLAGSQNPCPTAVHMTLLLLSLQKKKHEVHVDVCAVAVTVLVVVVVVVDMVSAVVVLCVWDFVAVMCPLQCVQCDCLAIDRTNFVVFHLLTSFEVEIHVRFLILSQNYVKFSDEGTAGPKKNLSWKLKDIQSGATPCISRILCTKATSKNNPQKKPGFSSSGNSSSRVIWEASGNWSGSSTKVITTVLRKLRDTATRTVLKERRTRFKSISEFVECHETSSTRTRSGWPKYRHKWTSCKIDIAPIPLPTIWERKGYPTRSAKHRGAPSKNVQHWILRTWRNIQNNSKLIVLEVFQKTSAVHVVYDYALAWTNRKDQQSKRLRIKSTIHHKRRSIWRTGPQQWQYDLWKATDATTAVRRRHF